MTPALLARIRRQYARYQRNGATLDALLAQDRNDAAHWRRVHATMSAMEYFERRCFCYVKALLEDETVIEKDAP